MNGLIFKRTGLTGLALALVVFAWAATAPAKRPASPTGTFSSMYYNEEGGDLIGTEIRIVYTRKGFQGTIQDAEGEPDELILFAATIDGDNHFTISYPSPKTGDPVRISGRVTEAGLETKTKWWTGGNLLKRAPSYWDVRRTSPP
jgi:hypothetical protein